MMKTIDRRHAVPFALVTSMFLLWGLANNMTDTLLAAFKRIMSMSDTQTSLIQFAFYGSYFCFALPAALFIRRRSFKSGIILGLLLYAAGAMLFLPAARVASYGFYLVAIYVMAGGCSVLETTANPFILSLGSKATSTRRLNLAQAFNPIGSLCGMAIASLIVLPQLISDQRDEAGAILYPTLSATEKAAIRLHDIAIIRDPYVALGLVVVAILVVVTVVKMPDVAEQKTKLDVKASLRRLWKNRLYRQGVVTQVFYVAAQIMVWTFIIQYADHLGIDKAMAQMYNIVAMSLSLTGRFVGTWLMKYVSSRKLLTLFAIGASICTLGTILLVNIAGLYCLVAISAFMSIMFPSIYGIALEDVEERDTTLGAAFLVEAIVGGSILPPLQGWIIDQGVVFGLPAVNFSFVLPLFCFILIFFYGRRAMHSQCRSAE